MSIVITSYEMPECCDVCLFSCWSNLHQTCSCKLKEYEPGFQDFSSDYKIRRSDICPLEERPTPSPAHWIPIRRGERGYSAGGFRCSQCGTPDYGRGRTNFCSQCGAWMHGDKQNEQSKQ